MLTTVKILLASLTALVGITGSQLALGIPEASAATTTTASTKLPVFSPQTALTSAKSASPESCANIIAAVKSASPYAWVAAVVSSPYCGSWFGGLIASNVCWQSRQWWGYTARAEVWAITQGHYTRC